MIKWFKSIGKYLMILSCGVNFLEYVQAEKFWMVIFIIGIAFSFVENILLTTSPIHDIMFSSN